MSTNSIIQSRTPTHDRKLRSNRTFPWETLRNPHILSCEELIVGRPCAPGHLDAGFLAFSAFKPMLQLLLLSELLLCPSHTALPMKFFIKLNPIAAKYLSELWNSPSIRKIKIQRRFCQATTSNHPNLYSFRIILNRRTGRRIPELSNRLVLFFFHPSVEAVARKRAVETVINWGH
jgi:hypothetical protein